MEEVINGILIREVEAKMVGPLSGALYFTVAGVSLLFGDPIAGSVSRVV